MSHVPESIPSKKTAGRLELELPELEGDCVVRERELVGGCIYVELWWQGASKSTFGNVLNECGASVESCR